MERERELFEEVESIRASLLNRKNLDNVLLNCLKKKLAFILKAIEGISSNT